MQPIQIDDIGSNGKEDDADKATSLPLPDLTMIRRAQSVATETTSVPDYDTASPFQRQLLNNQLHNTRLSEYWPNGAHSEPPKK